ncbi:MAG: hypothetical protein ABR886_07860 [Dehalococcoidales bacterium]|jgi:hypothetical protein
MMDGAAEYYQKVIGDLTASLIATDEKEQKAKLSRELERLGALVAEDSGSAAVTDDCNKLLDDARSLLQAVSIDVNAVLSKFGKVKQRLIQAYESRSAWPTWFWILMGANLLYLALIGVFIGWKMLIPGQGNLGSTAYVCLACALWGGFGGVVDAFFALHTHFSSQDFDRQYRPWYFLHPLLGLSLGAVIFLVLQAGLMAVSDTSLKEVKNSPVGVTALPIALAFLAGLKQNAAIEFLGRVVKSMFQND